MISTRDLSLLPDIFELKKLIQSLAILDAILEEKWELRYYSYNAKWNKDAEVGFMRNGSGDEFQAMFLPYGVIIKGFAHESVMSPYAKNPPAIWPGVIDNVPIEFSGFLKEPALSPIETTFCIWRRLQDNSWQCGKINYPDGKDPDGSEDLLAILDGKPETYQAWAEEYYEHPINLDAIKRIYTHQQLNDFLIMKFNRNASSRAVNAEAKIIGYSI
jgi:hypothetical protein